MRYNRGIREYMHLHQKARDFKTTVLWLHGLTGTGKSTLARNIAETHYERPAYYKQQGNWWCGYSGEDVVIWDDFSGAHYQTILNVTDRYPLLVQSKGGNNNFLAKLLIFTSNQKPEEVYSERTEVSALLRRINLILEIL